MLDSNYWELCNELSPRFRYLGYGACCEFDKISCSIRLTLRTFVIFINLDSEVSLVRQTRAEGQKGRKVESLFLLLAAKSRPNPTILQD